MPIGKSKTSFNSNDLYRLLKAGVSEVNIREFIASIEAAQRQFLPCLKDASEISLRGELKAELQQIEAARISEGQDPQAARDASCKRVKVLHGLGYPIDFDWLHRPVSAA